MGLRFGEPAVEIPIAFPWSFAVLTFNIDNIKISRQFFKSTLLDQPHFIISTSAPEHTCCDQASTFEYHYQGHGSLEVNQRPDEDTLVITLKSIGWYSTSGSRSWNDRTGWDNYELINITVY